MTTIQDAKCAPVELTVEQALLLVHGALYYAAGDGDVLPRPLSVAVQLLLNAVLGAKALAPTPAEPLPPAVPAFKVGDRVAFDAPDGLSFGTVCAIHGDVAVVDVAGSGSWPQRVPFAYLRHVSKPQVTKVGDE